MRLILLFLSLLLSCALNAQDSLPKFSVRLAGANRVIIGWNNPYDLVKQISIQRAHDSLQGYKTILSVADPNAVQNGFVDTKAPNDHMYYRLFIVLDKGMYYFTEARRPVRDTSRVVTIETGPVVREEVVKAEIKKVETFVPSLYVYTNKEGYVYISLPDADRKPYRIRFYEEDDSFLFELKNIRETGLTLDKANFLHAGWFRFELFREEQLVERHRFYLAREF